MKTRKQWICLIHVCILSGLISLTNGDSIYKLVVPKIYMALSGDLMVKYIIPGNVSLPHAFIRLSCLNDVQPLEITTLALPLGKKEGELPVTCGIIEFAGRFVVQLYMHDGGPLLTKTEFDVTWPSVNIILPDTYAALTSSVQMKISSSVSCKTLLNSVQFVIAIYHARKRVTDRLSLDTSNYITNLTVVDLTKEIVHEFPCNYFDIDGSFQAVLKSSFNFDFEITRSNIMSVVWSDNYNLNIRSDSIFPCPNLFKIIYTRPSCPSKDKIRMYMLKRRVEGSMAAPLERKYVLERKISPDMTSLRIRCGLFNATSAGYCFVYVSVSKRGEIKEQKEVCLAAHPDSVLPIDGRWSQWSVWGNCSACGHGKRSRHRMCNSPSPTYGGRFCSGKAFEWKRCFKTCPDWVPETPLKLIKLKPNCICGCDVNDESGEIIATGRCSGRASWIIRSTSSHRIHFVFKYINLFGDRQEVTIRNGDTEFSDILYRSIDSPYTQDIYSTGQSILVELLTSPSSHNSTNSNKTLPVYVHGFIAHYQAEAISATSSSIVRRNLASILDSSATIVGIVLCGVIVVLAIVFVAFHKIFQKTRHKYARAGTDSPLRSISSHGSNVHEIDDIQAPLTDEIKRKQIPANGVSRKSSVNSVCSAGIKRLCTKPETEFNKTSSNISYSPLVSSRRSGDPSEEQDTCNELKQIAPSPSLRKWTPKSPKSPNLRKCTPRSPKIHPSPKLKHIPHASSSPLKHELLKQKRLGASNRDSELETRPSNSNKTEQSVPLQITPTIEFHPQPKSLRNCDNPPSETSVPNHENISLAIFPIPKESVVPQRSKKTTSFISETDNKRPTSLTGASDSELKSTPDGSSDKESPSNERDTLLPKPDGQSPKGYREEQSLLNSPSSSKPSKSSSKHTLSSPTHSITPSEIAVEGLELEYDDFIDDDPLSYFDYDEMQRLKWHGAERLDKTIKEEED